MVAPFDRGAHRRLDPGDDFEGLDELVDTGQLTVISEDDGGFLDLGPSDVSAVGPPLPPGERRTETGGPVSSAVEVAPSVEDGFDGCVATRVIDHVPECGKTSAGRLGSLVRSFEPGRCVGVSLGRFVDETSGCSATEPASRARSG